MISRVAVVASLVLLASACVHPISILPCVECDEVPGEYVPGTSVATLMENLHSTYLRELREPVLWERKLFPTSTLRLSIAPPGMDPLSVRIERVSSGNVRSTAARFFEIGGHCPDRFRFFRRWFVDDRMQGEISREVWDGLMALLREARFEELPIFEPRPAPGESFTVTADDGTLQLELRDESGYRAVVRGTSSEFAQSEPFRKLCEELVDLVRFEDPPLSTQEYCRT